MKLAFVIPRYHIRQAGGAEVLVESLSERLAKLRHQVDVLTTCAEDHTLWRNDCPSGVSQTNGVSVHRFQVNPRPNLARFGLLQQRIERGWPINPKEEEAWISGSVHSEGLYQALEDRQSEWDAIIFAPYLFGLTYRGLSISPGNSYLIPCLHAEPYAYLKIFKAMFQKPKRVLFNSRPEKELGQKLYGLSEDKCHVVGMGFEEQAFSSNDSFCEKFKLAQDPYILYVGRRERGKNIYLLLDYFLAYKKHHPGPLKLVLVGSGKLEQNYFNLPDVIDTGFLSKEMKIEAYRGASVVCQPSINESFAIVLMESWLASTPVLVNGKCDVTQDHVQRSNGGLWFRSYFEFEEALLCILPNKDLCKQMAGQGKQYVLNEFKWDCVLKRFTDAIEM